MAKQSSADFQEQMIQMSKIPSELAILPINDAVVFPLNLVPLLINDPDLLKLADAALADHKIIGAFTQKNSAVDSPGPGVHRLFASGFTIQL